jgi:hypothetical protein
MRNTTTTIGDASTSPDSLEFPPFPDLPSWALAHERLERIERWLMAVRDISPGCPSGRTMPIAAWVASCVAVVVEHAEELDDYVRRVCGAVAKCGCCRAAELQSLMLAAFAATVLIAPASTASKGGAA